MNSLQTRSIPLRVLTAFLVIIVAAVLAGRLDVQPIKFGSGQGSGITSFGSPSTIPNMDLRAYLQTLDSDSLENAEALYAAAMSFSPSCKLPHPTTKESASNLYELLTMECPELFQLSNEYVLSGPLSGGGANVESVQLKYTVSESEYKQQRSICETAVKDVVASVAGQSEEDIERYCYDYIVAHCTYDETAPHAASAYGVFGDKLAMCSGISMAMKWLMEANGISCLIFSGDPVGGGVGHGWNSVYLKGQYYDVDVTADVSRADEEKETLYGAYNVSNTWVRNNYVLSDWCTGLSAQFGIASMDESFHVKDGTFIKSGSDWRLALEDQYSSAVVTAKEFCVQFEDGQAFSEAVASIGDIVNGANISYSDEYRTLKAVLP